MHIVVTGSLKDGFEFFGPFADEESANAYGILNTEPGYMWSVLPLNPA